MAISYGFFKGIDTTQSIAPAPKKATVDLVESALIRPLGFLEGKTTIMSGKVGTPPMKRGVDVLHELTNSITSTIRQQQPSEPVSNQESSRSSTPAFI